MMHNVNNDDEIGRNKKAHEAKINIAINVAEIWLVSVTDIAIPKKYNDSKYTYMIIGTNLFKYLFNNVVDKVENPLTIKVVK